MKLILRISILFVMLLSCGICIAQVKEDIQVDKSNVPDALLGEWLMDRNSVLKEIRGEEREKVDMMPSKVKDEFEQSLASKIFTFDSAGMFYAEWTSRGTLQRVVGKYIVTKEILDIVVNGSSEQFLIEELTPTTMVLLPMGGQRGLLKKLFFTRISE